jgi:hypothetical protein
MNTVRLALGARDSLLDGGVVLPVGTALFGAGRPGAAALEAAIETVEDAVMPRQRGLPRGALLVVAAPGVPLASVIGAVQAPVDGTWSLDAVKQAFGALAAVAQGRPAAAWAIDGPTAAALLIVRELMHHAGLAALRIDA